MPIQISGVTLGVLTGGPSSLNLSELHDVSIVTPVTGQYLRYNDTAGEWQNVFLNTDLAGSQGVSISFSAPITTIGLGAITPTSVAASGTVTGSNLSGSNTGDQTITLTGDVTGSGTGSFATTLADTAVTPGSYTYSSITVDSKGRITSASSGAAPTGTVTSVAISGANGIGVASSPITTSGTIALSLGAITPTSVAASGTVSGSNLSGSNTGDQTITLTGDVTGSGTGSFAATLATVNGNVGTFTAMTVNAKGLITAAANMAVTGDVTGTASGNNIALTLATVNASPQTDTFRKITVNGKGLTTASSAVTSSDITTTLGFTPVDKAGDTMTGFLILNADPTNALGAATKQYVDGLASGVNIHASCETGTTAPLAACTYANGAGGVGATLTANANGPIGTIGGYAVSAIGTRILVKDQVSQIQNGIYDVTQLGVAGGGGSPWILTRSSDFDGSPSSEVQAGDLTFVQEGSNAGSQWVQLNVGTGVNVGPPTYDFVIIGTDNIVFGQFAGSGTYTAGTGIDISTNIISNIGVLSNIAGTGISVSGATGNVTVTNTGVTSAIAGTNIAVSGATGAVTFSVTGTVPTATTATNLSGGAAGSLPFQSSASTTTMLAAGTSSQVLVSGATPAWTNTPTLTGTNFTGIPNAGLTNSSITIGSTNIALGATSTTLAGLSSVTSTTFVGSLTGASSLNVLKAGDTMTGALQIGTNMAAYGNLNVARNTGNPYATITLGDEATPTNTVGIYLRQTSGTAGISTGGSGLSFYRGGPATTETMALGPNGNVTINAPSSGTALAVATASTSGTIAHFGTNLLLINGYLAANRAAVVSTETLDLGTSTAGGTNIFTNNTVRVQVGAAGNVAIAAPSSGVALAVASNASSTLATFDSTTAGTTYMSVKTAGTDIGLIGDAGALTGASTGSFAVRASSNLVLSTGAAQRLVVGSAGNVLVNAPSSGTALTVVANGNPGLLVSSATGASASSSFLNTSNGLRQNVVIGSKTAGGSDVTLLLSSEGDGPDGLIQTTSNHPLLFGTNNTTRMTITAAGLVAVGGVLGYGRSEQFQVVNSILTAGDNQGIACINSSNNGSIEMRALTGVGGGGTISGAGGPINLATNGSTRLTITAAGDIVGNGGRIISSYNGANPGIGLVGDFIARRSTIAGVYYFGDTGSNYLYYDGTAFSLNGGSLTVSGDVIAFSDARLKTNVEVITDALSKVEQVRGVTFERIDEGTGERHTGVIAQELQKVLPEAVKIAKEDSANGGLEDVLSVSYGNVVGLLIEAIKELSAQNKLLVARIEALESK